MSRSVSSNIDIDAVIEGRARLSPQQALELYHTAPLAELGRWASARCEVIHGDQVRTYIIDRNINYTNVCSANCTFCAFKRDLGDDEAYVLAQAQLEQKIADLVAIGGTQVLLQGGMHPELGIEFYEAMLRHMREAFPQIHLHAFSPPEIVEFIAIFEMPGFPTPGPGKSHLLDSETWNGKLRAILERLRDAGLASIPGGGGEIFAPHVRRRIGIGKATADQWLNVMAMAHQFGMNTSATMMFGHIEGVADRIDHMARVRARQDRAIAEGWPGRYLAFISWPFQRENTPLGRLPEFDLEAGEPFVGDQLAEAVFAGELDADDKAACDRAFPRAGKVARMAGAVDYLRTQAISRLFLDNIHSIGASWVTMGPKIGQLALFYGANDMGSVMMEENVVSAAGTTYCLTEPLICHLVRTAGFIPAQRDNAYSILKSHDGPGAPDLQVGDWSTQRARKLHIEDAAPEVPYNPDPAGVTLPIIQP